MSFLPSHIPFHRLVEWVEATLSTEERQSLQQHLDHCSDCRHALAEVQQLISLMQSDQAVDPPPAVTARALRIFQPRVAEPTPSILQRMMASLQVDSLDLSPAMGLRSGTAAPRQLLFTAGDYDVDLRVTPTAETSTWSLSGQVLGGEEVGGHVELQSSDAHATAPLSPLNEFVLPSVPAGHYTLVLHLPDREIAIDSIELDA